MEYSAQIVEIVDNLRGVIVTFDGDKSGFVIAPYLKLSAKQKKKFAAGIIPECIQIGKTINVTIVAKNGPYHDLKQV